MRRLRGHRSHVGAAGTGAALRSCHLHSDPRGLQEPQPGRHLPGPRTRGARTPALTRRRSLGRVLSWCLRGCKCGVARVCCDSQGPLVRACLLSAAHLCLPSSLEKSIPEEGHLIAPVHEVIGLLCFLTLNLFSPIFKTYSLLLSYLLPLGIIYFAVRIGEVTFHINVHLFC